jgi:putative ATP-dependent endonuclease of OLD family
MILEQLIIINYRSWKDLSLNFKPNEPNIFIGLNDCGKSSILHAIDLLLGEKPIFNFNSDNNNKCDLSNSVLDKKRFDELIGELSLPCFPYDEKASIIIGKLVFNNTELKLMKEKTISLKLQWAIKKSGLNCLWYLKVFSGITNTATSYLKLEDSNDELALWDAKAADLKKIIKSEEITEEEINNENGKGRFSNFEQALAVYNKKGGLHPRWVDYKFAKQDKEVFPTFKYYDWNCSFEDIGSLATSIMNEHIAKHIQPIKDEAFKAASEAEKIINEEFSKISNQIKSIAKGVTNIKSKVHFNVKESISDIMVNKSNSDGDIHLELQGEGLKRQIWFSLIKANAEKSIDSEFNQFIWGFDEPETHLYPGAQRELFDVIKKLSQGNVQTLISTHSNIFIDRSKISNIGSVELGSSGYSKINYCSKVDDVHKALSVKNSDILFYDKFLVVEGDTEQHLIPQLYELHYGKTLSDDNIQLLNIKGKDKWVLNKQLIDVFIAGFKKTEDLVVYVFDNDFNFTIDPIYKTDKMFFVGKQDIEDSLDNDIWIDAVKKKTKDKVILTNQEIGNLKIDLTDASNLRSNEKFHPKLQKLVKQKLSVIEGEQITYNLLPSKGFDSSELILDFLTQKEQIPKKIIAAFEKLNE